MGARRVGGPKFRAFFPCPAAKFVFFFPLWGSSRGILVFEVPEPSNVHVWSSRAVVCEPRRPGLVGPPGFHTTAREPKRAHLRAPALQTPKFHEKTPREGRKKRILRRDREKERDILGGPGEGRSREGRSREGPSREHDQTKTLKPPHGNRETNTNTHKHTQTLTNTHKHTHPRVEVGLAKVGLAKVGFGQSRPYH